MNQAFVLSNPVSESQASVPQETFFQFIWRNKINRRYLLIAAVGTIVQFVIFKMLYPFPDFFSDSYSYLYAAYANLDVSIWPIGYSKFLRWFHFITYSDTALVAFQYFFLELGSLYFYLTILYFFRPSKINREFLFGFLFFNPLFLYLCNYVNSDPLFVALSLFWITQLIWILFRPAFYQVLVQGILLFLCFTIRNNAYYYPVIAIMAFLLSKQGWKIKFFGMVFPFLLIIPFIINTRDAAYRMTGKKQFSLFTGWQLANNALYIYNHAQIDSNQLPSVQSREVNRASVVFYSMVPADFYDYLSPYVGNYFIRQPESPLKQYFLKHYQSKDDYNIIQGWGKSSIAFEEFGKYVISHNVSAYARWYILLNTRNYFLPPLEKLEIYNLGSDKIASIAKLWFHYNSNKVTSVSKGMQGSILYIFQPLFLVIHLYIIGLIIASISQKRIRFYARLNGKSILLLYSFSLLNFLFCISATIIVFRYQIFPLLLSLLLAIILTDSLNIREIQTISKFNSALKKPAY